MPEPITTLEYILACDQTLTDIKRIFETNIVSEKFLLDSFSLPADLCISITDCICNGTCRAVSDWSFILEPHWLDTTAFTVHASRDDTDLLISTNWTTGSKADKGS